MHFMNWTQRVAGTFIGDYPTNIIKDIIMESYKQFTGYHKAMLLGSKTYR